MRTKLNRQQITGFWAAWTGWTLDGMDSVIYALVLAPALTELLPRSGIEVTPAHVGYIGSVMFALFLVGWGCAFIWGPVADHFGRTKALAATILVYALFTGASAFAQNIWELGAFRLLAGIGVGGEWAMAGTYIAEAWPEDRRAMGAGYLQTGYYFGFFFAAAALNYTVGAHYGWRAMFMCGLIPVVVSVLTLFKVKEPPRWKDLEAQAQLSHPLIEIFSPKYRQAHDRERGAALRSDHRTMGRRRLRARGDHDPREARWNGRAFRSKNGLARNRHALARHDLRLPHAPDDRRPPFWGARKRSRSILPE